MTQLNFMVKLHPSSQLQIHEDNGRGVAFSLKLDYKSAVFSSQIRDFRMEISSSQGL